MPNGDVTSSSGSDDDAPLRRPQDDSTNMFNLTAQTAVNNHVRDDPPKSSDRAATKNSPKKRNSGHDIASGDAEKVLINKTELDNIVYKNAKALRSIGLEPLLDLHAQLLHAVREYTHKYDRTKLPQELNNIVMRYVQLARK